MSTHQDAAFLITTSGPNQLGQDPLPLTWYGNRHSQWRLEMASSGLDFDPAPGSRPHDSSSSDQSYYVYVPTWLYSHQQTSKVSITELNRLCMFLRIYKQHGVLCLRSICIVRYETTLSRWICDFILPGAEYSELVKGALFGWQSCRSVYRRTMQYNEYVVSVVQGDLRRPARTTMYTLGDSLRISRRTRTHPPHLLT